ncbi:MAG: DUF835 domain-containing protein, partial [Thermoplasmata archaeon]
MGLRERAREVAGRQEPPRPESKVEQDRQGASGARPQNKGGNEGSGREYTIEIATTYIVEEESPNISYQLFKGALDAGMKGLIITRTFPKNLMKKLGLVDVPTYWLTNVSAEGAIGPRDLERLNVVIDDFLRKTGGVVIIDSLEYLVTNNKFASVLKLIQAIRDQVQITKSIGIITLKTNTLEPMQIATLRNEVEYLSESAAPSVKEETERAAPVLASSEA